MKWHRANGFPDNPDFEPAIEGGWQRLPEPPAEALPRQAGIAMLLSLPVVVLAWWCLPGWQEPDALAAGIWAVVLMLPLVVVHEAIHLLLHPGLGRSDQSVVGGSSRHGAIYAMYFGEMSRARYTTILLAPFAVLTVLPWLACLALGRWDPWLAGVSLLNAMFACGDLLGAWLVLRGSPAAARLRNRGYYTWWRPALNASS